MIRQREIYHFQATLVAKMPNYPFEQEQMPGFPIKLAIIAYLIGQALVASEKQAPPPEVSFRAGIHKYLEKEPQDPFTVIKAELESGSLSYDYEEPLGYLESLLGKLKISKYSQQLVFSTTSLQLSRISPRNPRAIYFTEDLYLGYVPGGQIEVIGIDPEIGAIPYIFSPPNGNEKSWHPNAIRSKRCMNCHANSDIGGVPGLLLSSVIPGPGGGSIDAFRQKKSGHSIPFDQRFGGWHLTGDQTFPSSWANATGIMSKGNVIKVPNPPGAFFDWEKYLVAQSDVIANLVLEHQVGFINRCIGTSYRLREAWERGIGQEEKRKILEREAQKIVDYVLFVDEAPIRKPISVGNSFFVRDFEGVEEDPLKKLNLKSRLMERRCSYMIRTRSFDGLPRAFKTIVFSEIKTLMTLPQSDLPAKFSYFKEAERREIDEALRLDFPEYVRSK